MLMRQMQDAAFSSSRDAPSLPRAPCLGPVVQPTNLRFWPTFWPHPSHWESWRLWFIPLESHLFLPCRYVIITDLPLPSSWKRAACIWIFHYRTIILQICHRMWFIQVRDDVHTLLYRSIIAAGCDQWPDMWIYLPMMNYHRLAKGKFRENSVSLVLVCRQLLKQEPAKR